MEGYHINDNYFNIFVFIISLYLGLSEGIEFSATGARSYLYGRFYFNKRTELTVSF